MPVSIESMPIWPFRALLAVLPDLENLSRVAQELVEDNAAEGVRYIEVRFAPQLHVTSTTGVRGAVRSLFIQPLGVAPSKSSCHRIFCAP